MHTDVDLHSCPSSGRRAFSLIELLAVICVIGILASLVFVSIQTIREHSLLAKSISNIRQLQAANSLYALDHDGRYVPIRTILDGKTKRWLDNQDYRDHLGIAEGEDWPQTLISPKAGVLDGNGNPRYDRSYGMNKTGLADFYNADNEWQIAMSSIENPQRTIALTDALDWIVGDYGLDRYPNEESYVNSAVAYRYEGKAAVVFYDGHAGAYTQSELLEHKRDWWSLQGSD